MQNRQPKIAVAKGDWISVRAHNDKNVLLIRKASIESINRFTDGKLVQFTVRVRNKKNCIEIPSTIFDVLHLNDFFRALCE